MWKINMRWQECKASTDRLVDNEGFTEAEVLAPDRDHAGRLATRMG